MHSEREGAGERENKKKGERSSAGQKESEQDIYPGMLLGAPVCACTRHTSKHMYICTYIYIYIYMCMYIYICIYIYIHRYIDA